MTANPNRRTVLTGTAASAVAAAVPASAAVSQDASALTGSHHRDGIWRVATQMPRNARAWIDAARAAGFTVGIGYADGKPGVVSGFDGVPSDVRDLVQAWGNGIPTAEIIDELEAEEPSPKDRRLTELADAFDNAKAELEGLEEDGDRDPVRDRMQATLRSMADLEPDTQDGVQAIMRAVDADWPGGAHFWEHLQNEPVERMVRNVLAFARKPVEGV